MIASERTAVLRDVVRKLNESNAEAIGLSQYAAALHSENSRLRQCVDVLCQGMQQTLLTEESSVRAALTWGERSAWEQTLAMGSWLRIAAHATRETLKTVMGPPHEYLCDGTWRTLGRVLDVLTSLKGLDVDVAAVVAAAPYYSDPAIEALLADQQRGMAMSSTRVPHLNLSTARSVSPNPRGSLSPPAPPLVTLRDKEHFGQRGYLLGESDRGLLVVQLLGSHETVHVPQLYVREETTQYTRFSVTSASRSGTPKAGTPKTTPRQREGNVMSKACKVGDKVEVIDVLHPNYGEGGFLRRGNMPAEWIVDAPMSTFNVHVTQFRVVISTSVGQQGVSPRRATNGSERSNTPR